MNIGDYVRTKDGIIRKIMDMKLGYSTTTFGHSYVVLDSHTEDIDFNDIIKRSSNIIDLIEVGDYVNGIKIDSVYNGILIVYDSDGDWYFTNEDIESIVTKEQFESIEYKIGE